MLVPSLGHIFFSFWWIIPFCIIFLFFLLDDMSWKCVRVCTSDTFSSFYMILQFSVACLCHHLPLVRPGRDMLVFTAVQARIQTPARLTWSPASALCCFPAGAPDPERDEGLLGPLRMGSSRLGAEG